MLCLVFLGRLFLGIHHIWGKLWSPHRRNSSIPQSCTVLMRSAEARSRVKVGEIPTCMRVLWELVTLVRRCLQKQSLVDKGCLWSNSMVFSGCLLVSAGFRPHKMQARNCFSVSISGICHQREKKKNKTKHKKKTKRKFLWRVAEGTEVF